MVTKAQKPQRSSSGGSAKNTYLIAYNAISAALWVGVLYQTAAIGLNEINTAQKSSKLFGGNNVTAVQRALSSGKVFAELDDYVRYVQSLAGLEVLHSLLGVVRSPFMTTLMQVASRFLLVWLIALPFPSTTSHSPAYTTMLLAWSVTEVIRYSYFVFNLSGIGIPKVLAWLRYNTFLILYPLGISSECWLVYNAIPVAKEKGMFGQGVGLVDKALWVILAIYVPGSYVLFGHMLKQRRRVGRELPVKPVKR